MAGKSRLTATAEQRAGLERQAASRDREEADRARAMLLSLGGWTSGKIGEALRVREDTVRDWRSAFMREGLEGIARRTGQTISRSRLSVVLRKKGASPTSGPATR